MPSKLDFSHIFHHVWLNYEPNTWLHQILHVLNTICQLSICKSLELLMSACDQTHLQKQHFQSFCPRINQPWRIRGLYAFNRESCSTLLDNKSINNQSETIVKATYLRKWHAPAFTKQVLKRFYMNWYKLLAFATEHVFIFKEVSLNKALLYRLKTSSHIRRPSF